MGLGFRELRDRIAMSNGIVHHIGPLHLHYCNFPDFTIEESTFPRCHVMHICKNYKRLYFTVNANYMFL